MTGEHWVHRADVHKVVGKTAAEYTPAATYPARLNGMGSPIRPHIRDDTLGKRNIAQPVRRKKKNLAIDAATSGAGPLP